MRSLETPLEIVFQEQSYFSLHSGQSLAWDHFHGIIANPSIVIANPRALSLIPAAIGGQRSESAGPDAGCCVTH